MDGDACLRVASSSGVSQNVLREETRVDDDDIHLFANFIFKRISFQGLTVVKGQLYSGFGVFASSELINVFNFLPIAIERIEADC